MEYKTEQHDDPDKEQEMANLKRNRKMAIVFGVISGFALISLVYAYVHDQKCKDQTTRLTEEIKKLEDQNKKCQEAALRQLSLSQEAVKQAYTQLERQQSIKSKK